MYMSRCFWWVANKHDQITSVPTVAMVSMYNPVTSTYQQVGVTPINLSAVEGILLKLQK